ncbi:terminase small subunit [Deinococcus aestuarii]|uniref:terminase small subunit n=1 Tax=Deinococcus aestuarii TaxID=2774531 RepID=UPI001C0B7855|nr:terminase small subunit [Deinococcus aestuarii]
MPARTLANSTRPLSPKQQHFLREYLATGNATRAARAAGYSPKNERTTGWRLLHHPEVRKAVEAARTPTACLPGHVGIIFTRYGRVLPPAEALAAAERGATGPLAPLLLKHLRQLLDLA